MSRTLIAGAAFWLCGFLCACHAEDVIYENPLELLVRGEVVDSTDGLFRVFPEELDLDLNRDGHSDLRFRHSLVPRSRRVDSDAVRLLRIAEADIGDNLEIVKGLRRLAIRAATEGSNDDDALARIQSQLDHGLDFMDRNTKNSGVVDGSYGLHAVASGEFIEPVSTTVDTHPGSYAIEVTTPAERANLIAHSVQTSILANDETLVINDVAIDLNEGMTQNQVVDRINDFASQTGVISDVGRGNAETRLYSEAFGTNSLVCVISNRPAVADSSGFGSTRTCDVGVDIEAKISRNAYTGKGATVLATGGAERGLAFRVSQEWEDPTKTMVGIAGIIDITNNSPVFVVEQETGESETLYLPNVRPSALGIGVAGNSFSSLEEIKLLSASQANDSLELIDSAYEQLSSDHDKVLDFLAANALPYGRGTLESLNGATFAVGKLGLLPAGVEVGPNLEFESGELLIQSSEVFRDLEQSGFIGAQLPVGNGFLYAWIGIEIAGDSSISLSDFAWNSVPNENVITGVASNRGPDSLLAGDANMDGSVNFEDFLICSGNFNKPGRWHDGDFNHDQLINFADVLLLSGNFVGATTASIPEPDSASLFVLAFCLLMARYFRRTRR